MSRFNIVLRACSSFPKVTSMAVTFVAQHKNPATLVPALSHKVRELLSEESDLDIFTAGAKQFPDLVIPAGKTVRDGIVDAIVLMVVKDTAAFNGVDIDVAEPLQGQSEYRKVVAVVKDDLSDKPVVKGKTAEEMAALLAEQGSDGCAGGGCKI